MSDAREVRKRNVAAGYVSLAVVVGVVAIIIAVVVYNGMRPGPKPYVMYVSNSGSIRPGDPVYMNGRHIGRVMEAQLVRRDGEVRTRVNFTVFERYADLEFSSNSVAAVVGPGLASGPRLVLSMGNSGESVSADGEFTNTAPASGTDTFTELGRQVKGADRQITSIVKLLDDQQMITDIQQLIVEFRETVDGVAASIDEAKPELLAAVERLDGAPDDIDGIRESLRAGSDGTTEGLRSMGDALADGDTQLAEFKQITRETIENIRAYEQAAAEAAEMSRDPRHKRLFLETRWAAAELAAMVDRSVSDPGAFGDAPGYRRAARKFNGGRTALEPFGGETKVNEAE